MKRARSHKTRKAAPRARSKSSNARPRGGVRTRSAGKLSSKAETARTQTRSAKKLQRQARILKERVHATERTTHNVEGEIQTLHRVVDKAEQTAKQARPSVKPRAKTKVKTPSASRLFPIVGIGASAGGLEAITEPLKNLGDTPGMPLPATGPS